MKDLGSLGINNKNSISSRLPFSLSAAKQKTHLG